MAGSPRSGGSRRRQIASTIIVALFVLAAVGSAFALSMTVLQPTYKANFFDTKGQEGGNYWIHQTNTNHEGTDNITVEVILKWTKNDLNSQDVTVSVYASNGTLLDSETQTITELTTGSGSKKLTFTLNKTDLVNQYRHVEVKSEPTV